MTDPHPLDNPAWFALRGRQAALGTGSDRARRFLPDHNLFAAAADEGAQSRAALAALVRPGETLGMVTPRPIDPLPGTVAVRQAAIGQMLAPAGDWAPPARPFVALGDADGAAMLALATLTAPGPFFARTHRMGDFIGVYAGGMLVAMAGERMKPDGFTEISAVCTHPDHRGRGYAAALMHALLQRIFARGEQAFLHVYPDNPAIALYRALGFRLRRTMVYTVMTPIDPPASP